MSSPTSLTRPNDPATSPIQYKAVVRASSAEVDEMFRRLVGASAYLEFGAGGTTKMACEIGVQSVVSVETDLEFCSSIIEGHGLRRFIDTGRLCLRHASLGPTKEWGVPIYPPKPKQIETYLSFASGPYDLALIDGRYRLACAASIYLGGSDDVIVMYHDFFSRPYYQPALEIFEIIGRVDDLAILKKRVGMSSEARNLRVRFFDFAG